MSRRLVCADCGSSNVRRAVCAVEDCERPVHARGWCDPHYKFWWRRHTGEVVDKNPYQKLEEAPGFWEQVDEYAQERLNVA